MGDKELERIRRRGAKELKPEARRVLKDKLPPLRADEMAVLQLDKLMVARYINLNFHLTVPELHEKLRANKCSAFEAAIISVLLASITEADHNRLEWLFTRIIGKVESNVNLNMNSTPYSNMTLEELKARKAQLDELNTKTLRRLEQDPDRRMKTIEEAYGVANSKSDILTEVINVASSDK